MIGEFWGICLGGVVATARGLATPAEAVVIVVVALSRLVWLVGGDIRRIFIAVVVVGLTVGRTVLLLICGEVCCGIAATCGILFSSDGFCLASVFLSAAMLAGLEM